MLRVTLEILPFGEEAEACKIAVVDIGNVSDAIAAVANYEYEARVNERIVRGTLERHMRQHGAIRLAARVLGSVVCDLERVPQKKESET